MIDIRGGGRAGFATDESLAYARSRRRFCAGEGLAFDESYRYAHLPLIAPGHPAVIDRPDGLDYESGRYAAARYSLVVPVPHARLVGSAVFRDVDAALRRSAVGGKIAFELCETRRPHQHITLAGGLAAGDLARVEAIVRARVASLSSLAYRLKGPFIGEKNFGRMYFPAYPAVAAAGDAYGALQDAIGARRSGFYAMGYYNLVDELNAEETGELQRIIDAFADEIVLEAEPEELWIMATHDDLALSARVVARIDTGKR